MQNFLLFSEFLLAICLVFLAVSNKSSSMGFGVYSENTGIGFNSFLFKITLFLIFLFIANTIGLSYIFSIANNASVVQ